MSGLAGQWCGRSDGDPSGEVIVDIDEVDGMLLGSAYLYPNDLTLPCSMMPIHSNNGSMIDIEFEAQHFDQRLGKQLALEKISSLKKMDTFCLTERG